MNTETLPTSSRNIWFCGPRDIQLRETPLPPLKDDEILCRSVKSLISQGSEVVKYTREMDDSMHKKQRESGAPFMGGYANSAEVIAVGREVKGFRVGEKLACSSPHNEFFAVHPDYVTHTPDDISHEENAWMTMLRTGLYACMQAQLKPYESVLIAGSGTFGICAVMLARIYNARNIVVAEPDPYRAALAAELGADHVLCGPIGDLVEEALEANHGRYYDVAIDATAWAGNIRRLQACVKNGGNISVIADPPDTDRQIMDYGFFHYRGQHVHGTFIDMQIPSCPAGGRELYNQFFPFTLQDCHDFLYEKIRRGELNVRRLIGEFVSPADCAAVFARLESDRGPHLGLEYDWQLLP